MILFRVEQTSWSIKLWRVSLPKVWIIVEENVGDTSHYLVSFENRRRDSWLDDASLWRDSDLYTCGTPDCLRQRKREYTGRDWVYSSRRGRNFSSWSSKFPCAPLPFLHLSSSRHQHYVHSEKVLSADGRDSTRLKIREREKEREKRRNSKKEKHKESTVASYLRFQTRRIRFPGEQAKGITSPLLRSRFLTPNLFRLSLSTLAPFPSSRGLMLWHTRLSAYISPTLSLFLYPLPFVSSLTNIPRYFLFQHYLLFAGTIFNGKCLRRFEHFFVVLSCVIIRIFKFWPLPSFWDWSFPDES